MNDIKKQVQRAIAEYNDLCGVNPKIKSVMISEIIREASFVDKEVDHFYKISFDDDFNIPFPNFESLLAYIDGMIDGLQKAKNV